MSAQDTARGGSGQGVGAGKARYGVKNHHDVLAKLDQALGVFDDQL